MTTEELAVFVGQRIKKGRQLAGLYQADVAKQLGITQAAWSKIESGGTLIGLEHLLQLPRLFKLPLSWFLPEDLLSDEDKKNALGDPRVLEILTIFQQLVDPARNYILESARLAAKLQGIDLIVPQ